MLVAIASDHAGYELKEYVKTLLPALHVEPVDFGCFSNESVDYPDFALQVAQAVNNEQVPEGILICGTGIGMSIAANRFPQVRAALCHDDFTAQASREHNNANILVMGARIVTPEQAASIVRIFFTTEFSGGRHARRLNKISQISRDILNGKYK